MIINKKIEDNRLLTLYADEVQELIKELQRTLDEAKDHEMPFYPLTLISLQGTGTFKIMVSPKNAPDLFSEHLEWASNEVKKWPEWKRRVLG